MKYRIIPTELVGKVTLNEAYLYYCLAFHSDFKSGVSHIKRESLAELYGTKYLDTITKALDKFESKRLIKIDRRVITGSKGGFKRNSYTLYNGGFWVQMGDGLLNEDIKKALKGFLILFKCICLNGTNKVLYNKSQIAERLNVAPNTVGSHLKAAIDLGYIREIEGGYELIDEDMFKILPESEIAFIRNFYPECLTDEELINCKFNNEL